MEYVALLRGINVGGHQVKMERLRMLFAELGLGRVGSYIQSGNIFFSSPEPDLTVLRQRIEPHLAAQLGWAAPVCLRTVDELAALVVTDPFAGNELTPDRRFAVTFFPEPHGLEPVALPQLSSRGGFELVAMTPTELFVVWHLQNGRPGSETAVVNRQVEQAGTTRFWHTTAKILAAAQKL